MNVENLSGDICVTENLQLRSDFVCQLISFSNIKYNNYLPLEVQSMVNRVSCKSRPVAFARPREFKSR